MQGMIGSTRRYSIERFHGDTFPGKQCNVQCEAIEVVTTKSCEETMLQVSPSLTEP